MANAAAIPARPGMIGIRQKLVRKTDIQARSSILMLRCPQMPQLRPTHGTGSAAIARTATFVKAAVEAANIPIHVNVGMGVGGVPMLEAPPIDSVTRASKSLVQIGKADGL